MNCITGIESVPEKYDLITLFHEICHVWSSVSVVYRLFTVWDPVGRPKD